MRVVCMDCQRTYRGEDKPIADGEEISHGLCIRCYATRVDAIETSVLHDWNEDEISRLPTGQVVLDGDMRVVRYSQSESRKTGIPAHLVLGRDFFSDIAPCMVSKQISEWCHQNVHSPTLRWKQIDWLLKLQIGDQVAALDLCAGKGRVVILIERELGDSATSSVGS